MIKSLFSEVFDRAYQAAFLPGPDGHRGTSTSFEADTDQDADKEVSYETFQLTDVGVELPEGFPPNDARELRDAYWTMKQGRFGKVTRKLRPFSKQLRDEIKTSFPIDRLFYDDLDNRDAKIRLYLVFVYALGTAVLFFTVFALSGLLVPLMAIDRMEEGQLRMVEQYFWVWQEDELRPTWYIQNTPLFVGIATLTIAGAGLALRYIARFWLIAQINQDVNFISVRTEALWSDMIANVGTRLKQVGDARIYGSSWPVFGRLYAILALWQAVRAEYFDRYSTAFDWKIEQFFGRLELLFVLVQWVVILAAFGAMGMRIGELSEGAYPYPELAGLIAGFAIYYYFAWYKAGRRTNDLWTERISSSIASAEDAATHPYEEVAITVQQLIKNVRDAQRQDD